MRIKDLKKLLDRFEDESTIFIVINNDDLVQEIQINQAEESFKRVFDGIEEVDNWSEAKFYVSTFSE